MTNEDKSLLELAAKAAGYVLPSADDHDEIGRQYEYNLGLWVKFPWGWEWFRPHIDDGEALRLAVKLRIAIEHDLLESKTSAYVLIGVERMHFVSISGKVSREEATRRAIVRAAAEIGKAMK